LWLGCAATGITWAGEPTTLQFTVADDRMSIAQDGHDLVSAPVTAALTESVDGLGSSRRPATVVGTRHMGNVS